MLKVTPEGNTPLCGLVHVLAGLLEKQKSGIQKDQRINIER